MYLQHEVPTILDVKPRYTILCIKYILPSGILLLKCKVGQEFKKRSKNCISCHNFLDDSVHLELTIVAIDLLYFICGEKKVVTTIFWYDQYQCR